MLIRHPIMQCFCFLSTTDLNLIKMQSLCSLESAVCYIIVELPFLLVWSFTLTYQLVNVPIRLLYHVSGEHKYNQSMENLPDFLFTGSLLSGE